MTIAQARIRLDETLARFWTDTELNEWLLEAARDVARRTETLQTFAACLLGTGIDEVTVPADLLRVHVVLFSTDDTNAYQLEHYPAVFPPRPPHEPTSFQLWGYSPQLQLRVWPTPRRTGTLYLAYYRTAATISDIPAGWTDLLTDYCEFHALRKDGDSRWQDAYKLYEQKIVSMIEMTRRWTDQAGRVVPDSTYAPFPFIPPVVPTGEGWDVARWDEGTWK